MIDFHRLLYVLPFILILAYIIYGLTVSKSIRFFEEKGDDDKK